ncbi:MAG TPA: flagellar protein FlaG [Burkholderiaceae bacterium]|nr:flagellar protein FlaG [Burkholderiaceae bacterium]
MADAHASAASHAKQAEDARQAVADANRQLAQKASELTFEFDENSSRVIVRLVDKQTGQVLRQIPSKEALEIARALQDESSGALLRTDA